MSTTAPASVPAYPYWAAERLQALPTRWREQMAGEWRRKALESKHGHGSADAWLVRRLEELEAGNRAGITPGMGDSDLCKLADQEARDYADNLAHLEGQYRQAWAHMPPEMFLRCLHHLQAGRMRHMMAARGLGDLWPDGPDMTTAGRLQRLKDPTFWRRVFRKVHARTVEQCAIALGLVHADADCYVSKESQRVHAQRQAANAAMLAKTVAVSERGDEMTLAAIAEKSVSNPTIRRGELMTRVSGFEFVADGLGHVKRWAVLTCPSRMHKWAKLATGKVVENKRYDGTKPRDAQRYLAQQWRRLCAHWEREGLRVYGFRTTEPHHDGCPHWNVLCFFAPMTERVVLKRTTKEPREAVAVFDAGLRRYFLDNDSANERGAAEHRVKIEAISDDKGSAAAYIAKYISKGIDGKGMEFDLYGNPIIEASAAVVAWARVWGIRQFQQIGGPPVTVWRELRRLHPENLGDEASTADKLRQAVQAVNLQLIEPGEKKAVAWARYVQAQGGPTCKRAARAVRLFKQDRGELNRYGEPMAARVVGVLASGRVAAPVPAHMAARGLMKSGFTRAALTAIESERCKWVTVTASHVDDALEAHCERLAADLAALKEQDAKSMAQRIERQRQQAQALRALEGELTPEEMRERAALAPWTRVNNCTATPTLDRLDRRHIHTSPATLGPVKLKRQKLGRLFNWAGQAGGPNQGQKNGNEVSAA